MSEDEYIKEGDIVLIDSKDDNSITEVQITDISPSGEYIEVSYDVSGINKAWMHSNRHLETLVSPDESVTEYEVMDEDDEDLIGDQWKTVDEPRGDVKAQDILARIRNRCEEFDVDEPIEAEVITQSTLAEFDKRNSRK